MDAKIGNAIETVFSTSMEDLDARRTAREIIEAANWRCTPETYKAFYSQGSSLAAAEAARIMEQEPILRFYEAAFDKILREMKTVRPGPDSVVLWHVYNMGYIVKTADSCFAIDLHHRRSRELADQLDFLLVTHNHGDHHTLDFLNHYRDTVARPIISNFHPAPGYTAEDTTLTIGPVTIHTRRTHHNQKLPYFVLTFEVELSLNGRKFVLYHSGDSCDPKQFRPHNPRPDVYIVHPRVGLKVSEAQAVLHPKLTLISHLHEMHHKNDQWRWPFSVGLDEIAAGKENGYHCAMPMWGEMIRLTADPA
ncbi:MAG: hypothetical protein IJS14_14890 [Lentisphaeria bacterium]|nr:hypothetical protein [Lentisphaeria bacterium]